MNVALHGTKRVYAVSVGTVPTLLNNTGKRNGLVIRNIDADDVFLGDSAVTIATGFTLKENEILVDEDSWDALNGNTDSWYGVVASGVASVRIIEYT